MDWDNFFLGLQGTSASLIDSVRLVTKYELFWGFMLGFFVSTLMHGFMMTNHPKNVPTMLFHDNATSFQKMYARDDNAPYKQSFTAHAEDVKKLKTMFALAASFAVLIILLALFSVR
jgi:hypothetical protein